MAATRIVIWHPITGATAEVDETSRGAWEARGWMLLAARPQPDEE